MKIQVLFTGQACAQAWKWGEVSLYFGEGSNPVLYSFLELSSRLHILNPNHQNWESQRKRQRFHSQMKTTLSQISKYSDEMLTLIRTQLNHYAALKHKYTQPAARFIPCHKEKVSSSKERRQETEYQVVGS